MKRTLEIIKSLIPTKLPMGMTEFNTWSDSIISIGDFPTKSVDDIRYVLAYLILQFGPTTAYKSKRYFILAVKAGAAKQIAGAVFQDIKMKQQAAVKSAQEAKIAASTASNSNGVAQNS